METIILSQIKWMFLAFFVMGVSVGIASTVATEMFEFKSVKKFFQEFIP
jgi:hypothetical protein